MLQLGVEASLAMQLRRDSRPAEASGNVRPAVASTLTEDSARQKPPSTRLLADRAVEAPQAQR